MAADNLKCLETSLNFSWVHVLFFFNQSNMSAGRLLLHLDVAETAVSLKDHMQK